MKTLSTPNLILRKLTPSDFNNLFENHSKEEIKDFLGHSTEADFEKEKSKYESGYSSYNRSFVFFQLIDKKSNKIIGACGLHNWNAEHQRSEVGYVMTNEDFKRKGLMTEALEAILEYGFSEMNLHRIEAFVGPKNIPSLKLMEHFGFVKEGLLKEHYLKDGVFEDSVVFSKLRTA